MLTWGWGSINLSMGLFRYVGLKLNYGAYVGLLIFNFIVGVDELN